MNPFDGPLEVTEECFCANCKNVWLVPCDDEMPEIWHPSFCPFCGVEFNVTWDME
jgi:hypothetical protein